MQTLPVGILKDFHVFLQSSIALDGNEIKKKKMRERIYSTPPALERKSRKEKQLDLKLSPSSLGMSSKMWMVPPRGSDPHESAVEGIRKRRTDSWGFPTKRGCTVPWKGRFGPSWLCQRHGLCSNGWEKMPLLLSAQGLCAPLTWVPVVLAIMMAPWLREG